MSQPPVPGLASAETVHVEEPEVGLIDYLRIVWRRRVLTVTVVAAAAVFSIGMTLLSTPAYVATVTLERAAGGAGAKRPVRPVFQDPSLIAHIIQEFGLDKPPHDLNAGRFLTDVLSVQEGSESAAVQGRPAPVTLRLQVALPQPTLAADVANALARQSVIEAHNAVQRQLEDARRTFKDAQARLFKFETDSQIAALRRDVDDVWGLQGQLPDINADLEKEKKLLRDAEEELERTDKARQEPGVARGNAGYISKVYEKLADQITASRLRITALERQRKLAVDAATHRPESDRVFELADKEVELDALRDTLDRTRLEYATIVDVWTNAQQGKTPRGADLRIVESAVPPARPASPRPLRNLAIGLTVGLVMSLLLAFLVESLQSAGASRPPRERTSGA
jgi:hypothetical protein